MSNVAANRMARDFFRQKHVRLLKWMVWKATWPALVIFMFYPLQRYITHSNQPFAHAFSHGDYLLLALLLLIETALDSEHVLHEKLWFEGLRQVSMLLGLFFTLLFAATRFDIEAVLPTVAETLRCERMLVYAQLNCVAAAIAMSMSLLAYYAACDIEDTVSLEKAGGDE